MAKVTGGCHCGAVRFEADVDTSSGIECNCSYCSKSANLLAFTGADQFRQTAGEDSLTDYRFNKNVIAHLFCANCGIGAFGRGKGPDGQEMAAINLRCVDGIDLDAVERKPFNGAAL
ncbi:MAG TPA: GFA family protein [Sphingomicrobium sp.]|nr:GFA family protein [Sphingomicrobium sp.]